MKEKIEKDNIKFLQSTLIENEGNSISKKNLSQTKNQIYLSDKSIESIKSMAYLINRKIRWLIFFLFIIINLLMNFDHGTVPAATEQLRNYLELSDSKLGFFGSLVFIGVIIGSLISMVIINNFNRKYILMICLILCGFSLLFFTKTKNYILLCIDRVIIGIFQAFISIYLPLWCDQFGIEKKKTLMIALIQIAPPLGVLIGYIVTTLLNIYLSYFPFIGDIKKEERWLFSFYIQSFFIWLISFFLLFFSDAYFISKARRIPFEIEETLNIYEKKRNGSKIKLSFFCEGNDNFEILKNYNDSPNSSEKDENEDFLIQSENQNLNKKNEKIDNNNKEDNINLNLEKKNNEENIEDKEINDENEKKKDKEKNDIIEKDGNIENNNVENNIIKDNYLENNNMIENDKIVNNKIENNNKENNEKNLSDKKLSFLIKLKKIFSEPLFICSILTLSVLFFIVTCIQYWTSDYMLIALGVEDEKKRLYGFSTVCLTSPTCGLLVGGYIVDKIGGYSNKKSLIFSFVVSFLSIIPAIPLPLVNSFYLYGLFLWILLFLGGALIPPIQGITIACLPKPLQGTGNSIVIFFYNLLGYLPAPFVYGFLKDKFNDEKDTKKGSRVAQKFTTWINFLAVLFIGIAAFIRFSKDKQYNEKMGIKTNYKNEVINKDQIIIRENQNKFEILNKLKNENSTNDEIIEKDSKDNDKENSFNNYKKIEK